MNYDDFLSHRAMVRDAVRTTAFRNAIAAEVKEGDVVLDVGAGSGVLSLFAAQAGAARVYAVERSPTATALARHLVAANGLEKTITVIEGDVRQLQLPEQVDVIVSEWMGTLGIDENMYGAVLWARDHFLKPDGGRIVPVSVTAMAAPVSTAQRVDAAFFAERPWGIEMGPLQENTVNDLLMSRRRVEPGDLAAKPQALWKHTALADGPETVRGTTRGELTFKIDRKSETTALALWFEADLGNGVALSNAPDQRDTHWGQMLLPLVSPLSLAKGDAVHVEIDAWPVSPGPLMFAWKWRVNDGPNTQLNTTGQHHGAPQMQGQEAGFDAARRSPLSAFLAGLAVDADRLAGFLADPDAAMADAGLEGKYADALRSQDAERIGMALFETGGAA